MKRKGTWGRWKNLALWEVEIVEASLGVIGLVSG
jgi:hypothetical protein